MAGVFAMLIKADNISTSYISSETRDARVFVEVLWATTTKADKKKSLCQFSEHFIGFEPWESEATLSKVWSNSLLSGSNFSASGPTAVVSMGIDTEISLFVRFERHTSKTCVKMKNSTMENEVAWRELDLISFLLTINWIIVGSIKFAMPPYTCDSFLAFAMLFHVQLAAQTGIVNFNSFRQFLRIVLWFSLWWSLAQRRAQTHHPSMWMETSKSLWLFWIIHAGD